MGKYYIFFRISSCSATRPLYAFASPSLSSTAIKCFHPCSTFPSLCHLGRPVSAFISLSVPNCNRSSAQQNKVFHNLVRQFPCATQTSPVRKSDNVLNTLPIHSQKSTTVTTPEKTSDEGERGAQMESHFYMSRLASREDPLWIHKISSILFLLSSCAIVAMFPIRMIVLQTISLPPSNILAPMLGVWIPSCLIQALSGAQMAFQSRKNDKKSRDVFLMNVIMMIINVWTILKLLVPLPAPLNASIVSQALMAFCSVSVLVMTVMAVYCAPDLLRTRNRKLMKKLGDDGHQKYKNSKIFCMDYFNYILPFYYPLPFIVATFIVFVMHDNTWLQNLCLAIPNLKSISLYVNVAATLAIGLVSLLVTLRDRKMIGKRFEAIAISVVSILLTVFLFETYRVFIGFEAIKLYFQAL